MPIIISKNLKETADFVKEFLAKLKPTNTKATILALYGDLGSGKTTFTQFLAKELGVTNYVTSPTFVIEKKYSIPKSLGVIPVKTRIQNFKTLIHLDCYRLNDPAEMIRLNWAEIVSDPTNLVVIEWPERIEAILPKEAIKLKFEFVSANERKMTIF
jgi:tRNA threonylcarbamoyladenosine biosynthesis protein TsaE